jgi:hypothetical protein
MFEQSRHDSNECFRIYVADLMKTKETKENEHKHFPHSCETFKGTVSRDLGVF